MTTNTVKNAKITTESVVNFVFFETLTTEKSAMGPIKRPWSRDGKERRLHWGRIVSNTESVKRNFQRFLRKHVARRQGWGKVPHLRN